MKTKLLLTSILLSLTFLSCKKENNPSKNILTSKAWHWGIKDNNPSTNPPGKCIYYEIIDCKKDDTFKFDTQGKLIINKGDNRCWSNEALTEVEDYSLNKETKQLVINGVKYTLAEESKGQIKYYSQVPSASGEVNVIYILQ